MKGFPGGAVVESPPADAGDTGSCPSLGRSHMPRSGWAREPWLLSLRISGRNGRGHNSERPAYHKKTIYLLILALSSPLTTILIKEGLLLFSPLC